MCSFLTLLLTPSSPRSIFDWCLLHCFYTEMRTDAQYTALHWLLYSCCLCRLQLAESEQYGTVGRVLIKCDCCSRARSVFRQTSCGWEEREEKIKIKNSVSQRSFLYLWLCSMKKKRWKKMLIVIVEFFSPGIDMLWNDFKVVFVVVFSDNGAFRCCC